MACPAVLDQIQPRLLAAPFGEALGAKSFDNQAVPADEKIVLAADRGANLRNFLAVKLDELIARLAVEVVVLGIAVVVLVHGPPAEVHFPQKAGFHQFRQTAVDGRPAHLAGADAANEFCQEVFGIEVIVLAEHLFDQDPALLGKPLPLALQVFLKPLDGREGYFDRAE